MEQVQIDLAQELGNLLLAQRARDRRESMEEVQEIFLEAGLWGPVDADREDARQYAQDLVLDNPLVGDFLNLVDPSALENLDRFENPAELAYAMTTPQLAALPATI